MPRFRWPSVSRHFLRKLLRIIIHKKPLGALAVNLYRHYVSGCAPCTAKIEQGDMTEHPDPETGFLEQLGQRVRTMRALRGMSRKVLAKVSGISERYIAQLESGKGNVSIVLWRRVSTAMGAHLEDLIPATEPAPDWPVIRDLVRKETPNQIAHAKDVLSGQGHGASAQRRMSFAGIALIGLRGAGKSTLGKKLAKKTGWRFFGAKRVDGAGDRRRHRPRAPDLRPDPVVVLHHLAEGRARRTHGAGAQARRP